jgi:hypothetical protein
MSNSVPQQKRIEIFVEGISELIFVRDLLCKIYSYDATVIRIHCSSLNPSVNFSDLWEYGNSDAKFHIEITDVGSYTKLLSAIVNRANGLLRNRTHLVMGLRDIDSLEYSEYRKNLNRADSITKIENGIQAGLVIANTGLNVRIYYAVTELEAWFLAFYPLFFKIDARLTLDFIKNNVGLDLNGCNPETDFEKPSVVFGNILASVAKYDDKPRRTTAFLSILDINNIMSVDNTIVSRYHLFLNALITLV